MLIDLGVDEFVISVADQAAVHGAQQSLAAAARALGAVAKVDLDTSRLRLFVSASSADAGRGEVELAPTPDLLTVAAALPDQRSDTSGSPDLRRPAAVLLGRCLEATLTDAQRVVGAHHTPFDASTRVVDIAMTDAVLMPPTDLRSATVCDPAVGGGVFLVAAAELLHQSGRTRADAVGALSGFDIDPVAVAVTETALALWVGALVAESTDQIRVADFLVDDLVDSVMPAGGWSHIVGNPPFRSQLAGRTARDHDRAAALLDCYGDVARGYVDEAGLFLLAGAQRLGDGGRLALIVPTSIAAARDATPLRAALGELAPLRALWVPSGQVFSAGVDTVAPVLARGRGPETVRLIVGRPDGLDELRSVDAVGEQWSELLADADGVPRVDLDAMATLGDMAEATAGFRQHFYALARAASDKAVSLDASVSAEVLMATATGDGSADSDPDRPVVTVGLIDPLTNHWGRRSTKLGGTTYRAPVVQVASIDDEEVATWVRLRRRPKVLVATQTRVIEALVDPVGDMVPSTPVISVEPVDQGDLWFAAAVLCAPPVTAWLQRSAAGGGLSRGRVKPSAALVRAIPLPSDRATWAEGAERVAEISEMADAALRRAGLIELGALMTSAYGADPSVTDWWQQLLPAVR